MLAWYSDISNLIEKTGDERNAFVRRHTRSMSTGSARSVSSDGGLEEDEADQVPFSTQQSMLNQPTQEVQPAPRPSPGGRFPSDIQVNRDLQAPVGPSSGSSSEVGNDLTTTSGGLQGTYQSHQTPLNGYEQYDEHQQYQQPHPDQAYNQDAFSHSYINNAYQQSTSIPIPISIQQQTSYYAKNPPTNPAHNEQQPTMNYAHDTAQAQPVRFQHEYQPVQVLERHDSTYGNWMAPTSGGATTLGVLGAGTYTHPQQNQHVPDQSQPQTSFNDTLQTPVPERHPNHTAPLTNPVLASIPNTSEAGSSGLEANPTIVQQPSLANHESIAVATASEKDANGKSTNPGIKRQNTDFSVSDLHVPGEYPKTPGR
jgi:hypothetical protein